MKDYLMKEITVEQAMEAYEKKGICCVGDGGMIQVEIECEDYCD